MQISDVNYEHFIKILKYIYQDYFKLFKYIKLF